MLITMLKMTVAACGNYDCDGADDGDGGGGGERTAATYD